MFDIRGLLTLTQDDCKYQHDNRCNVVFETCADLLGHTWLEPVWYYVKPKSKAIIDWLIDYNKLIMAVKRQKDVKFTVFTSLLNLMLG